MWQYYLLGRVMAQDRLRDAAADRRAVEAHRGRRSEPARNRLDLLRLRGRHHEA
ncbi:MAG: hypothetical protein ACHQZR_08325 [Candidatus Limnocylindrales bacterium]